MLQQADAVTIRARSCGTPSANRKNGQMTMGGTTRNRATRVAWAMLAVYTAGLGLGTALGSLAGEGTLLLTFTAFMVVGAVIVARRPGNSVGWIFSAVGLLASTGALAMSYAHYALTTRSVALPGAVLAAWYSEWFWYPLISLPFFTLMVFPTGRLLSPRWRPVVGLSATAIAVTVVLSALQPTVGAGAGVAIQNPIGINGIPDQETSSLGAMMLAIFLGCGVAAALSLVVRFRRSRGVERQQLKWFTYAGAIMAIWFVLGDYVLPDGAAFNVLGDIAVGLVPVAAGVAILRYRLYDIDQLIRRTVVYTVLTALVAGTYVSIVLILGQVFGWMGGDPPSWAIASVTLAVAALIQPARRRIQAEVDRRFNRSRYDAATIVAAFTVRLRDELDPDAVGVQLLTAVGRTMQPSQASLWFRPLRG